MSAACSLFAPSATALPGWFGKLPGMGDFAHRRLPEGFRAVWDAWLQRGLVHLRERHADWTRRYLEAPVWCFALGPRVVDGQAWIGVLMPSVDGVGRYFPFTLAVALDASVGHALRGEALGGALRWWGMATRAALEGLEGDLDGVRFEAVLQGLFVEAAFASEGGVGVLALPEVGCSFWWADPSVESGDFLRAEGLPLVEGFDALFPGVGEGL